MNKPRIGKRSPHVPKTAARLAMCDTKMAVNGCQVFLGHPDPALAQATARIFKGQLSDMIARAKVPNISDMFGAHLRVCERLKAGESIKEIVS